MNSCASSCSFPSNFDEHKDKTTLNKPGDIYSLFVVLLIFNKRFIYPKVSKPPEPNMLFLLIYFSEKLYKK